MTIKDYTTQISNLNNETRTLRKDAISHVKTAMSDLMKYVRNVRKQSDAIATKSERLLTQRLDETKDANEEYDEIADSLDELQMIDIASEVFWQIRKTVEDNEDKY